MSNFTKGPWSISRLSKTLVVAGHRTVAGSGGYQSNVDFEKTDNENEANANLIAAAPDMYAALEQLYLAANHKYPKPLLLDALHAAVRALKKARGESPEIPLFEGTREALSKLSIGGDE